MLGWLIEQYNTIEKVIVVEREAFYCFLKTQLLAVFFPKFSGSITFGDEHH